MNPTIRLYETQGGPEPPSIPARFKRPRTRRNRTQKPLGATPCGFDSGPRHRDFVVRPIESFYRSGRRVATWNSSFDWALRWRLPTQSAAGLDLVEEEHDVPVTLENLVLLSPLLGYSSPDNLAQPSGTQTYIYLHIRLF